MRCWQ